MLIKSMSRQNIVVWDLDSTLIHSIFYRKEDALKIEADPSFSYLKGRAVMKQIVDLSDDGQIGQGNISYVLVIFRPGAKEIINYSLENFDRVIIWSAGHKRYVRTITSLLIDPAHVGYANKKITVLTREDCNKIEGSFVLKDLKSKGFDLAKTIMIDDNVNTYSNNVENAIPIISYDPQNNKQHVEFEDNTLFEIMEWFKKNDIANVPDVRKVDKSNIYTKKSTRN